MSRTETVPAIEVRDLWLSFRGAPVLEEINLTVEPDGFLGIVGPNGAGKTVLLKVLLGLLEPDRGTVRVFGRPPAESRGTLAYVPQQAEFDRRFPIRVMDVVLMGRLNERKRFRPYSAEDRRRATDALDQVGLVEFAGRQVGKLSGGQLQRVLIARALAVEARVLLLDEPTSNLDSRVAGQLYGLLGELAKRMAVVLVDHDVGVMYRHVKSVGCLNRRMHYHGSRGLTREMLEKTYGYPLDVLSHEPGHRPLDGDQEP